MALLIALLLLCAHGAAAGAETSPGPCVQGPGVIVSACPGVGHADLMLMPEDAWRLDAAPPGSVTVTGGYTGPDTRATGAPKPVGIFIARGERISLELARMDGVLVVDADGAARISTIADVRIGDQAHDLRSLSGRVRFAEAAEDARASAMQSHLLIRDGALDLRDVPDAPVARRRVLFQTEAGGLAIWDGGGRAMTLYEAAATLRDAYAPVMALNLDMGGHDFCETAGPDGPVPCGLVTRQMADRLSNLLRLTPR
ncbi:MAG: hypothetical protein ACJA1L_000052 [Paracoccaceae bacterium]|jgi:hypothetical protein